MCAAGKLRSFLTTGGHWRVVTADLEAARQDSTAAAPANRSTSQPSPIRRQKKERVEELALTLLEKNAKMALQELEDEERQRAEEEEAAQRAQEQEAKRMGPEAIAHTEQGRQEQKRAEDEAMAAQARREWEDGWLEWALKCVPKEYPREIQLDVHGSVADSLTKLAPEQPRSVIERLVLAAVDKALAPWRRRREIEKALDEARKQLPYSAQGTYSVTGDFEDRPSEWDIRARQVAADAIRQLGNDAPFGEIRALAIQAGKRVAQEYKHQQACVRVVSGVWLPHGTASDDRAAREAVRQALEKLAIGSTQPEMEEVRDAALVPFIRAEAEAKTARKAAEARARVEREVDSQLYRVDSYLGELEVAADGWDFEEKRNEYAEKIKQEIRAALIEDLPLDWSARRARVEKLVDEWLAGHLAARS